MYYYEWTFNDYDTYDKWEALGIVPEGQADKAGIKFGWRFKKWNDRWITQDNAQEVSRKIGKAHCEGKITFYVPQVFFSVCSITRISL